MLRRMTNAPDEKTMAKMRKFVDSFCQKTGTHTHPDLGVTDRVIEGLARNKVELGRPLCPCRFYPDKQAEIQHRTWICACDDMQIYKYCHCLLFVNEDGQPITEHLPEDHEGRKAYGLTRDSAPDKGCAKRDRAEERERERIARPS